MICVAHFAADTTRGLGRPTSQPFPLTWCNRCSAATITLQWTDLHCAHPRLNLQQNAGASCGSWFCRYAVIARACGAKGIRDDDCTWDLEQSSTQVPRLAYKPSQARCTLPPSRVADLITQLVLWGASNSQRQVMPSSGAALALYFASCRIDDS